MNQMHNFWRNLWCRRPACNRPSMLWQAGRLHYNELQAGRLHHKLIGRLIVSCAAMVMFINAAVACVLASPFLVDDAGLRVRPASKELLDQAQLSIDKIQSRAERLSNRAAKGDDLKGKSESLRKEIVELYRMVHALTVTADELLLLGERDGELLRQRANQLIAPLDATVT